MKVLKDFIIPFLGLKEGFHDFTFNIDGKFFESFEYSEINEGKVRVLMNLEKQGQMMIFNFTIKGYVIVPCDRCLADMEYAVEGNERLVVKFGAEWKEETEEILIIPETDSHIDLSKFIYEYIMLMLPYKKVHPEGEGLCDAEMIHTLEQFAEEKQDPRWDALKDLKLKTE